MATVQESLKGVNAYPVPLRTLVEIAEARGLSLTADATKEVLDGEAYNLSVAALEAEFPFYYKSCSVKDFSPVGRVWLEFTLTIVFTGGFRLDDEDMILATEDGIAVYTEDDEYAINVRPNRFA